MSEPVLILRNLVRFFQQGDEKIEVLISANLNLVPGKLTALVGPSGAGKTTVLNIAGLLEKPNFGDVIVCNKNTSNLSETEMTFVRRKHIGFVFQFHRLFSEFSALENIIIPQMLNGLNQLEAEERALALLDMIGLIDRKEHRPGMLSGGEQQRVAIARAVANAPSILLADEPTGNLDPDTAIKVFENLRKIIHKTETAALIVTHNNLLAEMMDEVLEIKSGKIIRN